MPIRPLAALALLLLLLAGPGRPARCAPGADYKDVERALGEALASDDPQVRARAFDVVRDCGDPRAVDLILKAVRALDKEQEAIRKQQEKEEQVFEQLFEDKLKLDRWLDSTTKSGRDLDRYNAQVRKITQKMDAAKIRQKALENDVARVRGQVDGAVLAMGRVLAAVPTPDLPAATAAVAAAWLEKGDADLSMRWLDALAEVDRPTIGEQIRAAYGDAELDPRVRGAALVTLAVRRDPQALPLAIQALEVLDAPWDVFVAAVEALRRLHVRESIEPLIAALGREDLKRLREDVHAALVSLTGETHGPYQQPWKDWWERAASTFQMPPEPVSASAQREQEPGVTFYGIHTFSDRVLFILDVSGSMEKPTRVVPDGGKSEPRIETARRELAGAINNLNDTDRFNVILFNHQVIPWQTRMMEASERNRRRAIEWATAQPAVGLTNIHDALEAGFRMATRTTGRPDVDTVFFLTDGTPTAGKIQDPEQILAAVREWHRTANLRIHCVGVGEEDAGFLEQLAAIGGGQYVKR